MSKSIIERRTYQTGEVRMMDGEERKIEGYAALFDSLSLNLGGFREIIAKGAFDDVLDNDVRALFNHDKNQIIGRTKSGTLTLFVDERGLGYRCVPPETTIGNDLMVSVERGDITQSSFGFQIEEDEWDEDDEGRWIRTITKVKRLFDVSPVTFPAYEETEVTVRSFNEFKNKTTLSQTPKLNLRAKKLRILQLAG